MSDDPESWLPIAGYEQLYQVSTKGRVRSLARVDCRGQNRKPVVRKLLAVGRSGHLRVTLHRDTQTSSHSVARLVLVAFDRDKRDGEETFHRDGDVTNNDIDNLTWRRRLDRPRQEVSRCRIESCPGKVRAHGYCASHDRRNRLYGDPLASAPRPSMEERFWSKVVPTGFCWEWAGARDSNGYGVFNPSKQKTTRSHRFAYQLLVGEIPHGLEIDHLCRNRICCNPDHLEPVTPAENARRSFSPGHRTRRTGECSKGHSMSDAYVSPRGRRMCRKCIEIRRKR